MFLLVPAAKSAKNVLIQGTKSGLGAHGIKPVKSAAKALYALQSCYEGSPSRPRGAIVGGRRFA
jgi:DNA helicase II / ATP-dependent DNA helicase PcrA